MKTAIIALSLVANLALGGYLKVYDSRATFEASLQRQLKKTSVGGGQTRS